MTTKSLIFAALLVLAPRSLVAQGEDPWYSADAGGGRSTAGSIVLQSSIGQPVIDTTLASPDKLEAGFIPGLRTYSGASTTISTNYSAGWNLLSLPCAVTDSQKSSLFPSATSNAFAYTGNYVIQSSLRNGVGYWLEFAGPLSVPISGTTIQQDSVAVVNGWNMIGPPSYPALVSQIAPVGTTITSNFFAYAGGYLVADTLDPGVGYWVRVNHAGILFMETGSFFQNGANRTARAPYASASSRYMLPGVNDQNGIAYLAFAGASGPERVLYFSTSRTDLKPGMYDLPPVPPAGTDVRYSTNRMFELTSTGQRDVGILISSASYPLKIKWNLGSPPAAAALLIDGKEVILKDGGDITLAKEGSRIELRLQPDNYATLPKSYALHQNYPNPFNPTTTIKYDLPSDSRVKLTIYNALGQEVSVLADDIESAGFRSIVWNSRNNGGAGVSTGVYFYRLEATSTREAGKSFTQVKKMLLVK